MKSCKNHRQNKFTMSESSVTTSPNTNFREHHRRVGWKNVRADRRRAEISGDCHAYHSNYISHLTAAIVYLLTICIRSREWKLWMKRYLQVPTLDRKNTAIDDVYVWVTCIK